MTILDLTSKTETPGHSSIEFSVRMAGTEEGLLRAPWKSPDTTQGPARWLQHLEVFKTPICDSPNLSEVDLHYDH